MNIFYQPRINEGIYYLDEEESRHCVRVLRKRQGDAIRITDGQGHFFEGTITRAHDRQCTFEIGSTQAEPLPPFSIHIAISPTRNPDRIEWFVEKAVETGVNAITLIRSRNSERTFLKTDRLNKVAVSAMKQSLKAWLPSIHPLASFDDFVRQRVENQKYIAFVDPSNPAHLMDAAVSGGPYVVLIGPEGDFSRDELQLALDNGFIKVSLGRSRLRTETAGLVACHTLNLVNR